ncbi:hypothetical protein Nepgr_027558 [Nepenthes gracilis]|uniref:3-hydroxyisobutyrate dehydrogenase n=1 Tax=Nepenthes gracilis TaxID=150966 RepID=A0AAD3T8R2_NEPGR|nr:hypothetical protein Nepgr_027558 [Nepenthes gracilis]
MGSPYPTPITPDNTRIGWVGIGVMGGAMAARLLSAGYSVTIYARSPSKAHPLLSQGARLADSPASVARLCDIVFIMLGHPSDVRQIVLTRTDSILTGLKPNSVLVDHTSSHPELAKEISASARENNCWAVDAPVSGGDVGARTGNMAIFAGGDRAVVSWLLPLLHILGNRVTYMGGPGSGHSCKIANAIVAGGSFVGLSEGLVFARWAGLNREQWLEAVRGGPAGSRLMELFGQRIIDGDFKPGGFAEYMVKDLGMGVQTVEGAKDREVVVMPGAALSKELFTGLVANGEGKIGGHAIITVIERINGN